MKFSVFLFWIFSVYSLAQNSHIPLNEYRVLASHNSYKVKPDPRVSVFLNRVKKKLGEENDPIQLEYSHESLSIQLDSFDVRGFELDIYADPIGGRYYKRSINGFVCGKRKRSKITELKQPGFKIIHIPDVDYETNYYSLKSALSELVLWSNNNPAHSPVYVNIEAKGSAMGNKSRFLRLIGFKNAIPFDSIIYDDLNNEIIQSIPANKLISPRQFQGNFTSIRDRIDSAGWPHMSEFDGKIFFILEGDRSDWYAEQLNKGKDLPMFVYGNKEDPMTLFVMRNQPIGIEEEIRELTTKFIVRTRSDAGTMDARTNDQTRKIAAIKSGAQIISTDYYRPDLNLSDFSVTLKEINEE